MKVGLGWTVLLSLPGSATSRCCLTSCLVSSRTGTSKPCQMSTPRTRADTLREGSKSRSERAREGHESQRTEEGRTNETKKKREESKCKEKERERERLGLIKQFRYGGRRNMRSYPPSFECVEIFMQLPVRHPKRRPLRERREEMQPEEETRRRWWHSRLESVPSSVLKRFRSNFEVAGGRQEEEGPALLERFREHNRQVKRPALIKLRYDVCVGSFPLPASPPPPARRNSSRFFN